MQIGIGLATDLVVSGAVGSPKRMDYTLIGDGVNLASRLESACKYYGSRFLIAESTYRKLKGSYRIREIDEVIVQGRSLPVRIYEVLGYGTSTEPDPAIQDFDAARADYIAGNWDKAIAKFWDLLARDPEDTVCTLYIDRCERMKALAPPSWNGIWVIESK
jgi:adenylate cyclase